MGFVRDLVEAGSVGFIEAVVEHVGLFFSLPRRLLLNGSSSTRVRATDFFLRRPSQPLLAVEGLRHVEFQGALEDAQIWFVGSADVKHAFHQVRIPRRLQACFALPAALASEVEYTGKTVDQKRFVPYSLIYPVPTTLPMGSSRAMFFCQDVTDHCTPMGSTDFPCFVCRDLSTPPLLNCEYGMGSASFRSSYADSLGFWLAALTAETFILHVSSQVYRKPASMFAT